MNRERVERERKFIKGVRGAVWRKLSLDVASGRGVVVESRGEECTQGVGWRRGRAREESSLAVEVGRSGCWHSGLELRRWNLR